MVFPATQDSLLRLAGRLLKSHRSRPQDGLHHRSPLSGERDVLGEVYSRIVPAEQRRAKGGRPSHRLKWCGPWWDGPMLKG